MNPPTRGSQTRCRFTKSHCVVEQIGNVQSRCHTTPQWSCKPPVSSSGCEYTLCAGVDVCLRGKRPTTIFKAPSYLLEDTTIFNTINQGSAPGPQGRI